MFKDDPVCAKLLADNDALELINNTKVAADVDASQYTVVFFPGSYVYPFKLLSVLNILFDVIMDILFYVINLAVLN